MNTRMRFYRVVAGASLGAVLWAACSSPEHRMVANQPRIPSTPPNLLRYNVDTHPERLVGLTTYQVRRSTDALPTRPPVDNEGVASGEIVTEAAGAQPGASEDLDAYRKQLAEEALRQAQGRD